MTKRLPTAERQQQIAEVALRILAKDGPQALTLQAIGAALGLRDASILRHFANKQAIVDAAIARFGRLLDQDLTSTIEDPLDRLGTFVVHRLNTALAYPELIDLAYNTRLADAAGERAAVDAHIKRSARFVCTCIQDAQGAGSIPADVSTQVWIWVIAGMIRGVAQSAPTGLQTDQISLSAEQTWAQLKVLLTQTNPQKLQ